MPTEKHKQESLEIDDVIGSRIRSRRLELGLSLKELSLSSGLSIGLLSQVERGLSSPSVRTLSVLSAELGVSPSSFFEATPRQPEPSGIVVRKEQRWTIDYADGITKQLLTRQGSDGLEVLLVIMAARASSGDDFYTHPGEEAGHVIVGAMTLYVQDEVFHLKEGDTFKFKSTIPHRFENPGDTEAQVLWILTAPSYV
jgi:transcriptional regulator with XRE-family HTH domain